MSNVEHLFENALLALENDYYFGEWKRIEKDRYNTDGVSEEVIEAIWKLAIYTKYTYEPLLNAIPVEWILKRAKLCTADYAKCLHYLVEAWQTEQKYMVNGKWKFSKDGEKENEQLV